MPNSSVTVTGQVGPGKTITAKEFTNVSKIEYDSKLVKLSITHDGGIITDVEIASATTVTATLAAGVMALTVS